jgi:hypothetical protein
VPQPAAAVQLTACAVAAQPPAAAHEYERIAPPPPAPASGTVVLTQQISGAAQLQPGAAAASLADEDEDEVPVLPPAVVVLVPDVEGFPFEPPLLLLLDPPHATATETAIDTANMERNAFSFIASSFPNASFASAQRQRTSAPDSRRSLRSARSAVRAARAGAVAQNAVRSERRPNEGGGIRAYAARSMSSRGLP